MAWYFVILETGVQIFSSKQRTMSMESPQIADTPEPPYYAVIFSSVRTEGENGYSEMALTMEELTARQPGFLGLDSAREQVGITVCYWKDLESIKKWKNHIEHQQAQKLGHEKWYKSFKVRIAKVEREYGN